MNNFKCMHKVAIFLLIISCVIFIGLIVFQLYLDFYLIYISAGFLDQIENLTILFLCLFLNNFIIACSSLIDELRCK